MKPHTAPLAAGDKVEFLHMVGTLYTVKAIGKSSEMEKYVELEELPGYFAPHVLQRAAAP